MTADELAIARAKRQQRDTYDVEEVFRPVERALDEFVSCYRESVERRGRPSELEWMFNNLRNPSGAQCPYPHVKSLAGLLTVAIDRLARRKDAR
jgi:hypothetical protein